MTNNRELLLKHLESFKESRSSYLFEILPNTPLNELESVTSTIESIDKVIVKLQSQIESL